MRAAFYLRVSTTGQTTENQLRDLNAKARAAGWTVIGVYADEGISGARGRAHRPAFDRLLRDAAQGKVDIVAAWSVDRLGRSLTDLVGFLAELHALKVDLYLHQQAVDTTTLAGRALFGMLGVFAEFERGIIQERVRAGIARARDKGIKFGRPRVQDRVMADVLTLKAEGKSNRAIGRQLKIGEATVRRVIAEARP